MVLPYQIGSGFSLWRVVVTGRRDKLLIAGWAVYDDVQLHSRQGCYRGVMRGVFKNPGPRVAGLWGTPPGSPGKLIGLHRQGRSTARAWRGRASARPDKPSRFTTEACNVNVSALNTSHNPAQHGTAQSNTARP